MSNDDDISRVPYALNTYKTSKHLAAYKNLIFGWNLKDNYLFILYILQGMIVFQ
jgi:hypothetical protein